MPLTESEVIYSGENASHRWSDAQKRCEDSGKKLAKIRNVDDMTKVRKAFLEHHSIYWVGVKFNTSIKNFVWGDGTSAPNRDANFEAVVNRTEQLSHRFNKRCMFIDSDGSKLQAAQCETHYLYICQSGDHEDAGE